MKIKKTTIARNNMYRFALAIMALLSAFQVKAQDKINATAIVKEVTIFTSAAEVINQVPVKLPKGSFQLNIQNVANNLDINTVQIAGLDGITVLSVSKGKAGEMEITNPQHRRLKDSLDIAITRRAGLSNKQKATQGALKILNNDQLLSGGGKVDLGDLSKLVDYYQLKAVELNTSIESLNKSIMEEDKIINHLQDQIRTYTGGGGTLALQISSSKAIQGNLEVSYLTYAASWQAYYDLKAKSITSALEIFYKARVQQSTGVDWKNVKLILSTGNPTQGGIAPVLNPSYAQFYNNQNGFGGSLNGQAMGLKVQNRIQSMEKKAADEVLEEVAVVRGPSTTVNQNQLSATFDIEIPYDIMSNGEPHAVTLKEYKQPVAFKYYAVPKLDKDAFLLAELNDFEKLNLVPGDANITFENMFVGTSYIDPNITTDTLNLSMGRDKAITIKRERVMDSKSSQTSGGTKRQTYTYELRVRNGKSTSINMLLKDQYPISTDKAIEIDLTDNGGAKVNKETGVLTWMIDVKPGETQTYRFTFTVKSPKDRTITFN